MILQRIGQHSVRVFNDVLYAAGFFYQSLVASLQYFRRRQVGHGVITMQLLFTGVEALTVIALISISLGAVIIIQGVNILPQFGQGVLIYKILITVITRELGPLLCAFVVIARSATAIATELGHMVVSHQIEAYIATGVNPIRYLVAPRFIGVTLSMIILNLYFNLFGLVGSFILTQFFQPISAFEYFHNLLAYLKTPDIISSILKSLIFGLIVSHAATYNGLKVQQSSTEVPQMVIRSVVQGFTLCILADAIITMIYYL
jgi:phospholipid/cholesterol/gamma-HCH transport system permease protein